MKQYFAFQWHITDEFDQSCKHCYIFSEDNCKNLDTIWEVALFLYHRRRPYFAPGFLAASYSDKRT